MQSGAPQIKTWRKRIARWIPNATNTHTACLVLVAFPLQQLLHERGSILRSTYIACHFSSHYVSYSKINTLRLELIHITGVYKNVAPTSEGKLFVSVTRPTV
jgi:hypothetical protein